MLDNAHAIASVGLVKDLPHFRCQAHTTQLAVSKLLEELCRGSKECARALEEARVIQVLREDSPSAARSHHKVAIPFLCDLLDSASICEGGNPASL